MEVALQKNDSSCSTNSDGGSEDVELGERIQQSLLKKCDKNHDFFKVLREAINKLICHGISICLLRPLEQTLKKL